MNEQTTQIGNNSDSIHSEATPSTAGTTRKGHRLSKIVTRGGDGGMSGLGDGSRLPKTHRRFAALGDVDELNSTLGVLRGLPLPPDLGQTLAYIQQQLFVLGGDLSCPGYQTLTGEDITFLEQDLSRHNALLPPLKEFILPGGCPAAAQAHVCRSVCRRAERTLCTLIADMEKHDKLSASPSPGQNVPAAPGERRGAIYLNRLSDWLFVIARTLNQRAGVADLIWQRNAATAAHE